MATLLSTMRRIMLRLREDDPVASTDSDYTALIAEFIADSYDEVCEAHAWESLRHTVKVDLVADTDTYDLTRTVADGGGVRNSTDVATGDSELQWTDSNIPDIYLFDSDSDIDAERLIWTSREMMTRLKNRDRTDTDDDPSYVTLYVAPGSTGVPRLYMQVYPIPAAARVVELTLITQPTTLESDGTDDATILKVPSRPVYLLALMYALNERGEEIGEPGNIAERRYIDSLGAAIEKDISAAQRANRYDWKRD